MAPSSNHTVPTPLREIAKVVRSKNAGPFEITLDIIFKSREDFDAVKKSGVITRELISELYNVPTQAIITFGFFDLVNAVKITLPRPRAQGGDRRDRHACRPAARAACRRSACRGRASP